MGRWKTPMLTEPVSITWQVARVLEDLAIPYFIGGSLASAVHGVVRATMDVDLVAALDPEHVEPLVARLGKDFYADEPAIHEAVRQRGSFNLIHLASMFKIDIFVATGRPFEREEFARRVLHTLSEEPFLAAYVATAEDTILAKLEWYRQGNQASDRQWCDVLNVLKTQGLCLDLDYLRVWASRLHVSDLFERAWEQGHGK